LKDINRIGRTGHIDTTCNETVPWAIRCFLESEDFEDAIRIAIMTDGDTDTKADITGAIAEAYYQVPEELAGKAFSYLPEDMLNIVEQFCTTIQNFVV
jgi:ADP-ribosylglycohydrolase